MQVVDKTEPANPTWPVKHYQRTLQYDHTAGVGMGAVAVVTPNDWAVYIGATRIHDADLDWDRIAARGQKLTHSEAMVFFGGIADEFEGLYYRG